MTSDESVEHYQNVMRIEVDWRKRNEAIDALDTIHTDEAFGAIVSALRDENANVVTHALDALRHFGAQSVPILVEALSGPETTHFSHIISILQELRAPDAIPALQQLFHSPDSDVASRALSALIDLTEPQDARQIAAGGLNDKRQWVQRQCARAAARFGMVEAIPILYEDLTEPAPQYSYLKRKFPALALGKLGEPALEHLLKASYHEDGEVRQAVAEALDLIQDSRATARLVEMLDDPHHSVHNVAEIYIGNRTDIDPIPLLERRLNPAGPSVYALAGLGSTGRLEAVPVILSAVAKDAYKASEALYNLSHRYWDLPILSEDTSRVPEIAQALHSTDTRLVITAIWILGSLSYPYSKMREKYLEANGSLEGLETPEIYLELRNHLTPMLSHDDPYVRFAALSAIHNALPKAGVFAEAEGSIAAQHIAARLMGHTAPPPFDGQGYCFLEVGRDEAMLVTGNFLAQPGPQVKLTDPSIEYMMQKRAFESQHLQEWFGMAMAG